MTNLILRFFLILITKIVFVMFLDFEYYDLIIAFILFVGLILNYKRNEKASDAISNYFFWIIMFLLLMSQHNIDFLSVLDSFFILLIFKIIVLLFNYFKFKKVSVTSSYLSKIWIFVFYIYLTEIVLNSTHGFKNLSYDLGLISCFETFLIILKSKEWKSNCITIVN